MSALPEPDFSELPERLGHRFRDEALLQRALQHRSGCAEVGGRPSNERLEFLGDAVLGLVVAEMAYRHHDDLPEGKLT
ncbi:MAG: ribonuclease III, partial [Acidobacteria bacterium]|nr:ribonuclease III [Acidobacteriota bacterium]